MAVTPPDPVGTSKSKRVQAPRAVLWLIPTALVLFMEWLGLRDRDGWGPLSNAVWVITEDSAHGVLWWLVGAFLCWIWLHFWFPGVDAFGWRGLAWIAGTSVFAWATGRYALGIL